MRDLPVASASAPDNQNATTDVEDWNHAGSDEGSNPSGSTTKQKVDLIKKSTFFLFLGKFNTNFHPLFGNILYLCKVKSIK